MRSALFWDVMQRRVIISHRRFGTNYLSHIQGSKTPKSFLDFLNLEVSTDRLSRKCRCGLTAVRCITFQKSAVLVYVAAGAWSHATVQMFHSTYWLHPDRQTYCVQKHPLLQYRVDVSGLILAVFKIVKQDRVKAPKCYCMRFLTCLRLFIWLKYNSWMWSITYTSVVSL